MVGVSVNLPMVELDTADSLVGGVALKACGAQSAVAAVLLVLLEPSRDRGGGHAAIETRRGFSQRVAEVVVGERRENHTKRIRLVAQRRGPGCERALTGLAAPQLHDLEVLAARAAADEVAAAAIGTRSGLLGRERSASDAWDSRRHTRRRIWSPYHAPHGNRTVSAQKFMVARLTDFGDGVTRLARRCLSLWMSVLSVHSRSSW